MTRVCRQFYYTGRNTPIIPAPVLIDPQVNCATVLEIQRISSQPSELTTDPSIAGVLFQNIEVT